MSDAAVRLVPTRPDAEIASEYRTKMLAALAPVCEVIAAAERDGLTIQFGIAKDGLGRQVVSALKIVKEF